MPHARLASLSLVLVVAALGAVALFSLGVAGATGDQHPGPADPSQRPVEGSLGESLPCTTAAEVTNFEVFSAGPNPFGLPLSATLRRCDNYSEGDQVSANYVSYIYGDCVAMGTDTGCSPPLEIQTWPACQRNLADYTFEGKAFPHQDLSPQGGATVVEFEEGHRVEVYTASATVVIFANDPAVAVKAVSQLRPQSPNSLPATRASELESTVPELEAPEPGATEGALTCGA